MRRLFKTCAILLALHAALAGHAQTATSPAPNSKRVPSRMNCSPLTPNTKVPWIEASQLPDLSRDHAYFEWCTDLDTAWTTQSYPDPKYVPTRTAEHEARVYSLLQGLKDLAAKESEDWVSHVNALLGSNLPPPTVERRTLPTGNTNVQSNSHIRNHALTKLESSSKLLSVSSSQHFSDDGTSLSSKRLNITGLTSEADCINLAEGSSAYRTHCRMGQPTEKLCITPTDLQKAFENRPGYLLRPASVRTAQSRPTPAELVKLGGQWFGYEVHVFSGPATGKNSRSMYFGFGFKPCAASISVNLTNHQSPSDKK